MRARGVRQHSGTPMLSRRRVGWAIAILMILVFSKSFYTVSLGSFYTFYLIHKFDLTIESAQVYLFVFLAAVAVGTLIGGPLSDRIGRKYVMWGSILGVLPFTLMLPYANLVLDRHPDCDHRRHDRIRLLDDHRLCARSGAGQDRHDRGLFFGLSFGLAGVGAAVLGRLADATSIDFVYRICAFLPAIGLLTAFLPNLGRPARA